MHSSRNAAMAVGGKVVSAQGGDSPGVVCLGGVSQQALGRGVSVSVHAGIHVPLWTEFLTHACENITFPQLRYRR